MKRDEGEGRGRAVFKQAIVHFMSLCCRVKAMFSGGSKRNKRNSLGGG